LASFLFVLQLDQTVTGNQSRDDLMADEALSQKFGGAITIRRQLRWLAFIGVCGLLIFAGVSFTTLSRIDVNGPLYRHIRLSNHLVANYVPPSQSMLEPALVCTKLVEIHDPVSVQLAEKSLKEFELDYKNRYSQVMEVLPEGPLRNMIQGEAHETALQYFRLADHLADLVNENRYDEAHQYLIEAMNPLYDRHAAAVNQIVRRADDEAHATEAQATRDVSIYTTSMVGIGLLLLVVVVMLSWLIARGVSIQAGRIIQSEESLRHSEELYRSTFDQAAVGIIHTSFDGIILRCNTRFAEILGYSMEEILGQTFQRFTPVEYRYESLELMQRLVTGVSNEAGLEKPYLRKDGSLTWVRLTSSVQFDAEGKPLHLAAFIEDINARRATEEHLAVANQELQTKDARYRAVF
jgi:PAS domain S-box-containing protein